LSSLFLKIFLFFFYRTNVRLLLLPVNSIIPQKWKFVKCFFKIF
jgi:hypothetical protein